MSPFVIPLNSPMEKAIMQVVRKVLKEELILEAEKDEEGSFRIFPALMGRGRIPNAEVRVDLHETVDGKYELEIQ